MNVRTAGDRKQALHDTENNTVHWLEATASDHNTREMLSLTDLLLTIMMAP